MADENEINKEESAASLTRDSSKQIGGKKYSFKWRSQTNAVNMPKTKTPKESKHQKRQTAQKLG